MSICPMGQNLDYNVIDMGFEALFCLYVLLPNLIAKSNEKLS